MKSRLSKLRSRFKFNRPENLRIVALSITTAAVFWFFNALNKDYDATVGYPINWEFDPEEYIVVDELPNTIRINVNGLGWNLVRASLGLKVNPVTIQLTNPASNKKLPGVSLTNRVDDDLEELQLNYILDDTLRLNIDYRRSRSFAVYIDSANISLAENYRIVSPIEYDVQLLEIEGPADFLNQNPSDSFLITIPNQDIRSNYSDEIEFEMNRPELFLLNPNAVNVSFQVAEFVTAEREVVIEQMYFPEKGGAQLADTTCTVQFLVEKDLEPMVLADSFKVVADYRRFNKADTSLILRLRNQQPEAKDVIITFPQVRLQYNE